MKTLSSWFQEPDYQTGVELLQQLDPKTIKLTFYTSVENSEPGQLHHNLLKSDLERLHRIAGQTVKSVLKEAVNKAVAPTIQPTLSTEKAPAAQAPEPVNLRARIIKDNPFFKFENLSSEMQELYNEIGESYKKMTAFHEKAKLEEITNEDRKHAINQAAQLEDSISEKYTKLDAWVKAAITGEPEIEAEAEENTEETEKLTRLKNVRSSISKLKKKFEGLEEGSEAYQALVDKREELIAEREELEEWKNANS